MSERVSLNVTGADDLARTLNLMSQAVRRQALYGVLRPAAEPMRARMSQLAPRRPPAPDLADHIGINAATRIGSVAGGKWQAADEFQAAVAVGPEKGFHYGIFLEYGTVHISAQPFMRPAFDGTADASLDLIREGLWALIRAEAPGPSPSGTGGL